MLITAAVAASATETTLTVTRATLPSFYPGAVEAVAQEEGDAVQVCILFETARVDDIIYELLSDVVGIDDFFLPVADWAAAIDQGYQSYLFNRLITEPVGVKQLLEEITQHNILLWWDERAQEVKLDTMIPRQVSGVVLNDTDDIMMDSVAVTDDIENRVSQVWVYTGIRSPIIDNTELKSYSTVNIRADLDAESRLEYGGSKIRQIFSEWLPTGNAVSSEIASRYLLNYKSTTKIISLIVDSKNDRTWTGQVLQANTQFVQDEFGRNKILQYRILEAKETLSAEGVSLKFMLSEQPTVFRFGMIAPDLNPEDAAAFPDYTPASQALKDRYAFIGYDDGTGPPPEAENFPDNTSPYQIV